MQFLHLRLVYALFTLVFISFLLALITSPAYADTNGTLQIVGTLPIGSDTYKVDVSMCAGDVPLSGGWFYAYSDLRPDLQREDINVVVPEYSCYPDSFFIVAHNEQSIGLSDEYVKILPSNFGSKNKVIVSQHSPSNYKIPSNDNRVGMTGHNNPYYSGVDNNPPPLTTKGTSFATIKINSLTPSSIANRWNLSVLFCAGNSKVDLTTIKISSDTVNITNSVVLYLDPGSCSTKEFTVEAKSMSSIKVNSESQIPSWVKNNAKWWSQGSVGDNDFVKGMQYLVQQGIIKTNQTQQDTTQSQQIPTWVKNNAGWWANDQISEDEFLKGVQFLITSGIIKV